jgi:hypothetical protein
MAESISFTALDGDTSRNGIYVVRRETGKE